MQTFPTNYLVLIISFSLSLFLSFSLSLFLSFSLSLFLSFSLSLSVFLSFSLFLAFFLALDPKQPIKFLFLICLCYFFNTQSIKGIYIIIHYMKLNTKCNFLSVTFFLFFFLLCSRTISWY